YTAEGRVTASIAVGAITDAFGNTGSAFLRDYGIDFGTVPYPLPLTATSPLGSLVYSSTVSGQLGTIVPTGDTDSFTVPVDAGQTISVIVAATSASFQPTVEVRNPSGNLLASATAPSPGKKAVVSAVPATASGTYTIVV